MINIDKNIKVACILDVFSYECLKYECNLIQLDPYNWEELLLSEKPDLLLVESAWRGIQEKWRKKVGYLSKSKDKTLEELVQFCKNIKIPTVFWNKEDPYHFELFLPAAKLFDFIFTTDSNSIDKYKKIVGHDNVFSLPFAAQPRIHNPIEKDKEKIGDVAFAGTWYNNGHEDRKRNLVFMLSPALKYNFHIYDRNYNNKQTNSYRYPEAYQPYVKGCLTYEKMVDTYKKYHIFLNVNSVNDSPTMFSRRVFELLACGTNVVSSYSLGIENMFCEIVKLCKNEEDTIKYLDLLLKDKELRDKISLLGQREVFNKHTYTQRFHKILDKVGILYKSSSNPGVSIITCINNSNDIDKVFLNYNRQLYENKELIIILNKDTEDLEEIQQKANLYSNVKVFSFKKSLAKCIEYAVSKARFDYISIFGEYNYYAPEFIRDLMNAFKYADADIVGKGSYYVYLEKGEILSIIFPNLENCYVNFLCSSAMIIRKTVLDKIKFKGSFDRKFFNRCTEKNIKLYSTDKFNYVCIRPPSIKSYINEKALKIKDGEFLKKYKVVDRIDDYREIITV